MLKQLENKRLAACADLMRECSGYNRRAADIGTDHGYLAAYLVESGICGSAVAADINPLPLASAKKTIAAHGLTDRVSAVLSDGLDSVPRDGVTDIICAGMGGELIADILSRCGWARECTLILQPMSKPERLREWLYDNGYAVLREVAVRDGRFVYTIMRAEYAPEGIGYNKSERYLAAGLIDPAEGDGAEYIRIAAERLRNAAEGMLRADGGSEEGNRRMTLSKMLMKEL